MPSEFSFEATSSTRWSKLNRIGFFGDQNIVFRLILSLLIFLPHAKCSEKMAPQGDNTAAAAFATAAAASCCAVWAVWRLRKERESFFQEKLHAETALTKALKLRAEERLGRTNAERRLRCFQKNQDAADLESECEPSRLSPPPSFQSPPPFSAPGGKAGESPQQRSVATNEQRLVYQPIGFLESCYRERRGTPRQGMLAPAARSKLRILPKVVQAAALEGIEEFSHVCVFPSKI